MKLVVLRKINQCTIKQQESVREIRNQQSVRKSMYTEHEINPKEHLAWIERLNFDNRQLVFVVLISERVVGLVSIYALDLVHKKSDWAFYLDERARGGLGAALEYALIDYAFDCLGLEKLNCEVIETNTTIVKMHKKFGFLSEGFRHSNIEKNGERIGVHFLGLTKQAWIGKKVDIYEKYRSILDQFNIMIEQG